MGHSVELTRDERKERRRKMAREVAAGSSVSEVAAAYDLERNTVRKACREHRVELPPQPKYDWGKADFSKTTYQISRAVGCSLDRAGRKRAEVKRCEWVRVLLWYARQSVHPRPQDLREAAAEAESFLKRNRG